MHISQKRGKTQYFSQPDYILACGMEMRPIKRVGFCFLRFFHSDHCGIVTNIWEGRRGRLKQYPCMRQKIPLSIPTRPWDANTTMFDALAAKSIKPKPKWAQGKEWISEGTWKTTAKQSFLLQSSWI